VSVKPEKNIVKFLKYFMKYFKAKNFMKFYITTHDKTKLNVLTAASEMVFKFIELYYVG